MDNKKERQIFLKWDRDQDVEGRLKKCACICSLQGMEICTENVLITKQVFKNLPFASNTLCRGPCHFLKPFCSPLSWVFTCIVMGAQWPASIPNIYKVILTLGKARSHTVPGGGWDLSPCCHEPAFCCMVTGSNIYCIFKNHILQRHSWKRASTTASERGRNWEKWAQSSGEYFGGVLLMVMCLSL